MNRYRYGGIIAHIIMQVRECMGNVYKQTELEKWVVHMSPMKCVNKKWIDQKYL